MIYLNNLFSNGIPEVGIIVNYILKSPILQNISFFRIIRVSDADRKWISDLAFAFLYTLLWGVKLPFWRF